MMIARLVMLIDHPGRREAARKSEPRWRWQRESEPPGPSQLELPWMTGKGYDAHPRRRYPDRRQPNQERSNGKSTFRRSRRS